MSKVEKQVSMNRQSSDDPGEVMRHYITFHRFRCQSNSTSSTCSKTRDAPEMKKARARKNAGFRKGGAMQPSGCIAGRISGWA